MKKILISGVSLFGLGASMATAGGMEVGRFSPGFMFEGGNYAEMSITQTTPKVTDDTFAPNKSMLAKMTNTSLSVKMAVKLMKIGQCLHPLTMKREQRRLAQACCPQQTACVA
jgi:hypothetical protein